MNWTEFLKTEKEKDYFKNIIARVQEDAKMNEIYPKQEDIFNAFKYCEFDNMRVVLLGQDPYINPNEAMGMCFSVPVGISVPPSLRNIFKEIKDDLNIDPPNHGCLIDWAKQGVFLLNTSLTVRRSNSGSHTNLGWQEFTDNVISIINNLDRPIVYMLWGAHAKNKKALLNNPNHLVLETSHPSFFSVNKGFFGCKHFSKCNKFLITNGQEPINWSLANV